MQMAACELTTQDTRHRHGAADRWILNSKFLNYRRTVLYLLYYLASEARRSDKLRAESVALKYAVYGDVKVRDGVRCICNSYLESPLP